MNALKISLTVIVFALLLSGCAKKLPVAPDWVNGKPGAYPQVKYIHGVGMATAREDAAAKARAEIAKQFRVKVDTLLTTLSQYTGMEGSTESNWLLKNSVSQLTKTYVDETIEGMEIVGYYEDPQKSETIYALAVLARSPARKRLEMRVLDLDREIANHVKRSEEGQGVVSQLRPLVAALEFMKEREIKNNQLSVINPTGQGLSAEITSSDLNDKLNRALEKITISVSISGDGAEAVHDAVVASLNNGRLSVAEGDKADIVIEGKVKGMETNQNSGTGFVFAKFNSRLTLKDGSNGKVFGSVEHSYRDGANNLNDAREKTLSRLSQKIVAEFNRLMYKHLTL